MTTSLTVGADVPDVPHANALGSIRTGAEFTAEKEDIKNYCFSSKTKDSGAK